MTTKRTRKDHLITNGPLLNFHIAPMIIVSPITGEDLEWASVEHWFQACKGLYVKGADAADEFASYKVMERIRKAPIPRDAKRMGGAACLEIHLPLWNRVAFAYMLQGHIAKFSQRPDLRQILLATGNRRLVEHRPDKIWGDGMDGTGKNYCGRSLMMVRRMAKDWKSA